MADDCENFVAEVHAQLLKMRGSAVPKPSKVGAKYWAEHSRPPLVRWARGSRGHETATTTGGDTTPIYLKKQTLLVEVWHEDEEQADLLLDDVIRAARIAAGGSANLAPGPFAWVTEEHPAYSSAGAKLLGAIVVNLEIAKSNKPVVRVTIGSQSHTETLTPQ